MMIIAGSKPKLCCSMERSGMLNERVESMHAHTHYVCVNLSRMPFVGVVLM